jgi:hypothetical protein
MLLNHSWDTFPSVFLLVACQDQLIINHSFQASFPLHITSIYFYQHLLISCDKVLKSHLLLFFPLFLMAVVVDVAPAVEPAPAGALEPALVEPPGPSGSVDPGAVDVSSIKFRSCIISSFIPFS